MRFLIPIFLLVTASCMAQEVTKEAFLNDFLKDTAFYSIDDHNHMVTLTVRTCDYHYYKVNDIGEFIHYLPDSSILQMKNKIKEDTAMLYWDNKMITIPSPKKMFFVTCDEINILMDRQKKRQANTLRKKYDNPSGYYVFCRPIFDNNKTYAIFYYAHFCGGLCGNGEVDLYKRISSHWQKIAEGAITEY